MDECADGDAQDAVDMVDERAQEPDVAATGDQAGLLAEFVNQRHADADRLRARAEVNSRKCRMRTRGRAGGPEQPATP
ncbi:hypothetical protein ACWGNF_32045 [Streptomyces sp. NPDC055808]